MKPTLCPALLRYVCVVAAWAVSSPSLAAEAHVHSLMRLDIAVDKQSLTLQLESPLDSLLGFEHRPQTAAQRQAADALLTQLQNGAALFKPDAAAQCTLANASIESAVLQTAAPAAGKNEEHADIDARYAFTCAKPDQLNAIDTTLFDAFKRLQKIEVQVAGTKGQSKQTLKRPARLIKLTR